MKKLLTIFGIFTALYSGKTFAQCAGCPTVNAQIATGPSTYICLGQSANLTASATPILGANTNAYTVTSIPYAAQPFSGGVTAVSNCDDCWGGVQNLPFTICYYGNAFNQFVVGSNGMLTFNTAMANGYCAWPISAAWPNIVQCGTGNVLGAPWRDINMAGGYAARFYTSGVAPFRTFVVYWDNVPYYSCGSPGGLGESVQLIFYESTSIIECHILRSNSCPWNSGAGIVGIQNVSGAASAIAPARNYPGAWSANNEAWRYSPSPAVASWTWTSPAGVVGTGTAVTVTPTVTTVYTAQCVAGCAGGTVQVVVNTQPTINPSSNSPICQGAPLNLTAGGGAVNTTYTWSGPGSYTAGVQNPVIAPAQPSNTGVYTLTAANNFTAGPSCFSTATCVANVVPVNQVTATPFFTLCQGAQLNLTAQNLVPPTSYSWTGPAPFTSTLQNPIIPNVMPAVVNGDYTVVATFTSIGTPLVCQSQAITNVSIVATSPVTVTLPQNICQGATANLTASTNPVAQYDWTGPNNFAATGASTSIPNIMPVSTGLYNVLATWSIGSVSCTINGFNQINVVPVNPISITAPTAVCYPANVSLYSNSQGAISYNWTGPNSFTSNLASPLLSTPGPTASGLYSVTTAYTNGAIICYNSNTTNVTVNPILNFSLPPYNQVCHNSLYTIAGPAGATTYTWLGVNGYTANTQNLSIPFINSGQSGTYTLNVNLGPCKTSSTTKVDVLSPISFTQTPGNKVICKGDSVKVTVGATGGSQNYAYTWVPQLYLGSPTGSAQAGLPNSTTIYNVTGYDIACPEKTISSSFTITVNAAPTPDLRLPKTEGCQPLCMVYNSRTQEAATSITYNFGNGHIMQADSFAYCLTEPGTYNLQIQTRGANGCTTTYNYPTPILVHPTSHSEINWTPDFPSTTQNQVTFDPVPLYGTVVKREWMFQGANNGGAGFDTSSVKNPTRTYDNVGKYPVMLTSTTNKGCVDTTFKVLEIKDEFSVFVPNTFTPNGDGLNDIFNIKGTGLKTEGYTMEIYDRWGSLLYTTKELFKGWDGSVKGTVAENGVYVYKIKALGANGEGKKEFVGHVSLLK